MPTTCRPRCLGGRSGGPGDYIFYIDHWQFENLEEFFFCAS